MLKLFGVASRVQGRPEHSHTMFGIATAACLKVREGSPCPPSTGIELASPEALEAEPAYAEADLRRAAVPLPIVTNRDLDLRQRRGRDPMLAYLV